MTTTDSKWQCPECRGHWSETADQCPFCKVVYGQHIARPRSCCHTDPQGGHRGTCRHSMMNGGNWDGDL